jgi:hypothetical protein
MKILNYKILELTGHIAASIYKAKLDDHVNMVVDKCPAKLYSRSIRNGCSETWSYKQ